MSYVSTRIERETGREYEVLSLSCAETAVELRKALKARFPGQKFSVRSQTYSGGASIHVSWTDGPFQADVDRVCDRYEGATFDGMIDLKSYRDPSFLEMDDGVVRKVSFGADFIPCQRSLSPAYRAQLLKVVRRGTDRPDLVDDHDTVIDTRRGWRGSSEEANAVCRGACYDGTTYVNRAISALSGVIAPEKGA